MEQGHTDLLRLTLDDDDDRFDLIFRTALPHFKDVGRIYYEDLANRDILTLQAGGNNQENRSLRIISNDGVEVDGNLDVSEDLYVTGSASMGGMKFRREGGLSTMISSITNSSNYETHYGYGTNQFGTAVFNGSNSGGGIFLTVDGWGDADHVKMNINSLRVEVRNNPLVAMDYLSVGTRDQVEGTVAHFDGRVYISEEDGTERGLTDQGAESNYHDYLLWVEEGIVSKDFALSDPYLEEGWPDFVFAEDYNLSSLSEVQKFIQQNGHLPTMPSAQEIGEHGYTVNEMNKRLLQSVEELTLHTIAQEEEMDNLKAQLKQQQQLLEQLLQRVEQLEGSK